MNFDMVIHNGSIITMNAGCEVIADGLIGIKGGRIEHV
jgi:predicted amidohydrolase YtcJ